MAETKFTLGPWNFVNESASSCRIYPPDPTKPSLALVYDACQGKENIQANARLIAAAPELFNAARRLMAGTGLEAHDFPCGCCVCEMAAAIAKAVAQ